ncbi:MAG: Tocopherol O-methyltransferase [Gammaproteobacteria bacterium]|jgi:tocopherol O-methyltransferase|nr:Tocopherol O-methyltransferase [Gammaproteobacteria bacterium]
MEFELRTDRPLFNDPMQISKRITQFWEQISPAWSSIWGPHIHHGFYENDNAISPLQAQEKLIDELAAYLELKPGDKVLDVGCGMGGSSLYLAKHYGVSVTGVSLSEKQVLMATERAKQEKVHDVSFKVEDALAMDGFNEHQFDVVWALESCEQFFDKSQFIREAHRVLKPGGKLMLATWCSNQDSYQGQAAKEYKTLCNAFDLPYMPSIEKYKSLLEQGGFNIKRSEDWSPKVAKSWDIGISLVRSYSFLQLLMLGGIRGLRFAKQIKLMKRAFQENRVRYGVFIANSASANCKG